MRFIVDECTGPGVAKWLEEQQHDALSIYDELCGLADEEILNRAVTDNRIVITNDKDFGEMVYRDGLSHCGVILMRLADERTPNKIEVLRRLLEQYADQLTGRFVVVTETSVRIAGTKSVDE